MRHEEKQSPRLGSILFLFLLLLLASVLSGCRSRRVHSEGASIREASDSLISKVERTSTRLVEWDTESEYLVEETRIDTTAVDGAPLIRREIVKHRKRMLANEEKHTKTDSLKVDRSSGRSFFSEKKVPEKFLQNYPLLFLGSFAIVVFSIFILLNIKKR